MRLQELPIESIQTAADLRRSGSSKSFEDRLRSSIEEIGLAEPLKVANQPDGLFLVIDGNLRLEAIRAIHDSDPTRFSTVPAYLLAFDQRYEIRYQSDIYQDLLPSQLATLVEHLHRSEQVRKNDIARYIGVSPPTLRNYTGLWRLLERDGLFARIVELMDAEILPASNPYAWLRLTVAGLRRALVHFADGADPDVWIDEMIRAARQGSAPRYQLKYVEAVTASLPPDCYRVGEEARAVKRDLGLRRAANSSTFNDLHEARRHLIRVSTKSSEPVLKSAAKSLQEYLA